MTAGSGWGTFDPQYPCALLHLERGLRIDPLLYSARAETVDRLSMGGHLRLGTRAIDGSEIRFCASLAETTLDMRYTFTGREEVALEWSVRAHGEWGLRFWVVLVVSGPDGFRARFDPATGAILAPDGVLALIAAKAPLLVTAHDSAEACAAAMEANGYFDLSDRAEAGTALALRFNLEEAPHMAVRAVAGAAAAPGRPPVPPALPADAPADAAPDDARARQAVHDVIAWNHVRDPINDRLYTVLTRNWNARKFGGFGVWMNDIVYHAYLWGLFDLTRARQNLDAVFAFQTEAGNFPCLVTGKDRWLDRSQPPIVSFVVLSLARWHGDTGLLSDAYPRLCRNHDWWWRCRRPGERELVVYGTSPGVGDGLYKGTKLGAKNESSMDNMAVHDEAPFDEATGLLMSYDVGLNALLCLDAECLGAIAERLGRADEAARHRARAERHRAEIERTLWDERRDVFANRLVAGPFVEALAPTSFFPLAAGACDPQKAARLVRNNLLPRERFGGFPRLPSAAREHPAYRDNVYWRGRIWAPHNFWTFVGLSRAGFAPEAAALAKDSLRLFEIGWRDRLCGENYNAETGAITDQADTDWFYGWGALLPALSLLSRADVTPTGG